MTPSSTVVDPPPAAASEPAPTDYHTPARGRMARLVIVLCFALTLLATVSIYWRWATVKEPTSYIVVEGDDSHDGTLVVVNAADRVDPVAMATLNKSNSYGATIFLHPGTYTLVATLNGEELVHRGLLVGERRWTPIKLKSRKPVKAAAGEAQDLS